MPVEDYVEYRCDLFPSENEICCSDIIIVNLIYNKSCCYTKALMKRNWFTTRFIYRDLTNKLNLFFILQFSFNLPFGGFSIPQGGLFPTK